MRAESYGAAEAAARTTYVSQGPAVDAAVVDRVWAVVVVRPRPYDCVGAIRTPDGRVPVVVPDRATRWPGEGGCSPADLVRPVRTH